MTNAPAGVSGQQRFHRDNPCPVCGGYTELPQGQGERCWGFVSRDGLYAHCMREEKAGKIVAGVDGAYAHRLRGSCKCGVQHGPDFERSSEPVVIYRYVDFNGEQWEKGRFETPYDKSFSWRRKGLDTWPKGRSGVKLHELRLLGAEQVMDGEPVFYVEGEKARQALEDRGYIAVCAGGGAGQKRFGEALNVLHGKDVLIWPDFDDEGRQYAIVISLQLKGKAKSVRIIDWPGATEKGDDAWDFFSRGGDFDQLGELVAAARDAYAPVSLPAVAEQASKPASYRFDPATTNEFVLRFLDWRSISSDAPHAYAEALAIGTLAAICGPRLRIPIRQASKPLTCAMYIVILGDSTIYRKSDSLGAVEALLQELYADILVESPGSPEAFVQELATHDHTGGCWFIDEAAWWFNGIKKKSYLTDLKGYLMRAYDGSRISRRLRDKRAKGGVTVTDTDVAVNPALTIMSGSTPERMQQVSSKEDIEDGFWPRWVIVWPATRPPLRPLGPPDPKADDLRQWLKRTLLQLQDRLGTGAQAILTPEAWQVANKAQQELEALIEKAGAEGAIYSRAELRIFKVAALLAVMDDLGTRGPVKVHEIHVEEAAALVNRWLLDARRFADSVGMNEFESAVSRVLAALKRSGGNARRRDLARVANVSARTMNDIEDTVEDRGLVEVSEAERGSKVWRLIADTAAAG